MRGKIVIPNEESVRRWRICKECPQLHNLKICKVCKCVMPLKVKLKNAKCPEGKW